MVSGAVRQIKLKQMVIKKFQDAKREHAAMRIQRKFRAIKANEKLAQMENEAVLPTTIIAC